MFIVCFFGCHNDLSCCARAREAGWSTRSTVGYSRELEKYGVSKVFVLARYDDQPPCNHRPPIRHRSTYVPRSLARAVKSYIESTYTKCTNKIQRTREDACHTSEALEKQAKLWYRYGYKKYIIYRRFVILTGFEGVTLLFKQLCEYRS
jgi:hypothetical protein